MIHKDCGGKLTVIESFQQERKNSLVITRYRKCKKCGVVLHSTEQIAGAVMEQKYKHRNYYNQEEKSDDTD